MRFSLSKKERLCSDKEISELFAKGKRFSFTVKGNTLQCVYLVNMSDVAVSEPLSSPAPLFAPSRIFISVPKRNLKRAVDRNRVKRLIREGYRLQKNMLSLCNTRFNIAFVYQGSANVPFGDVRSMIKSFFDKILSNETRS
jgi:ribonuclease P protein component